jgi:hypothetical protein
MCIPHFFSLPNGFRRSTFDAGLVTKFGVQDKRLTIYIKFGKFKLEKAPNFVNRPASNVDRRTSTVERRPSNAVRKRGKTQNAHINEMRSKNLRCVLYRCFAWAFRVNILNLQRRRQDFWSGGASKNAGGASRH